MEEKYREPQVQGVLAWTMQQELTGCPTRCLITSTKVSQSDVCFRYTALFFPGHSSYLFSIKIVVSIY